MLSFDVKIASPKNKLIGILSFSRLDVQPGELRQFGLAAVKGAELGCAQNQSSCHV